MASHSARLVATFSSSSSSSRNKNSDEQEQRPRLSGAYIRSLVKHLSSSSSSTASRSRANASINTMTSTTATPLDHRHRHQQQQPPQREQEKAPVLKPQMKKQARRRTHASRPYQERLLNMAEARREIVTALKIHRANMRQQPRCHQPEQPPPPLHPLQQQQQAQMVLRLQDQGSGQAVVEEALAAAPATSHAASFADQLLCNSSPLAHLRCSSPILPYHLSPLDLPAAIGDVLLECHSLGERLASCAGLPAQPLGLNLSFQGFSGYVDDAKQLEDNDCGDLYGGPLIQSSSLPAASPWAAYSAMEMELASTHGSPAAVISTAAEKHPSMGAPAAAALMSPVLDDGETQPIGERPQSAECSGTMTAADVTAAASAWWSKIILEGMESGGGGGEEGAVGGSTAADLVAAPSGLPAEWRWPCDDDDGAGAVAGPEPPQDDLETMLVDDGDYSRCCYEGAHSGDDGDTLLPCMDDIEGWDGEWFSASPDDDHSLDAAHGCAVDQQSGGV